MNRGCADTPNKRLNIVGKRKVEDTTQLQIIDAMTLDKRVRRTRIRVEGFVMLPVIVVMPSSLLFFFVFGFVALELDGLSKTTYLPPRDSGK
ncbi:hypothetical protein H5410_057619, partial [Solanum commersonii]